MNDSPVDPKTEKLRKLCSDNKLSPSDVCDLTGRGISIVHHWMSGKYKQIPDHMLVLLELKIQNGHKPHTKEA
ncbi:MAG: hypothetical protein ACREA9_29750 [Pyrinomonadaceae bacterium]